MVFYVIVFGLFSCLLYAIYFYIKKIGFVPLKAAYLWIYFKHTIQFGFLFILAYIAGAVQPWLYEEDLSNLEPVNGTLEVRWGGKSNDYYIRKPDGTEIKIKFNLANLHLDEPRDSYDGENVIVWHRMRYVYQMENDRGEIVFPIESANRVICVHNLFQGLLYIFFIFGWIVATLRSISMSKAKDDMMRRGLSIK